MFQELWNTIKVWLTQAGSFVETYDESEINAMTKKELDAWAENKGVKLDRRMTKSDMLEELKKHLNIV